MFYTDLLFSFQSLLFEMALFQSLSIVQLFFKYLFTDICFISVVFPLSSVSYTNVSHWKSPSSGLVFPRNFRGSACLRGIGKWEWLFIYKYLYAHVHVYAYLCIYPYIFYEAERTSSVIGPVAEKGNNAIGSERPNSRLYKVNGTSDFSDSSMSSLVFPVHGSSVNILLQNTEIGRWFNTLCKMGVLTTKLWKRTKLEYVMKLQW